MACKWMALPFVSGNSFNSSYGTIHLKNNVCNFEVLEQHFVIISVFHEITTNFIKFCLSVVFLCKQAGNNYFIIFTLPMTYKLQNIFKFV